MTQLLEKRLSEVVELMDAGIYTANEAQFLIQMLKAQGVNIEKLRQALDLAVEALEAAGLACFDRDQIGSAHKINSALAKIDQIVGKLFTIERDEKL